MNSAEISILGKKIGFIVEKRSIFDLKFYRKNPRVLSTLYASGHLDGTLSEQDEQDEIFKCLQEEQSVISLLPSIQRHEGINEPIIVQASNSVVLEGNSRLAALRMLAGRYEETDSFSTVTCRVIAVEQEQIDSLLSSQHIDGKTEWSPFSKAYVCYHRVEVDDVLIDDYAHSTGMTTGEITKCIEIIKLMIREGAEDQKNRFSHYELFVRPTKLRSSLEAHPELKRFLLDKIKDSNGHGIESQHLRDSVPKIAKKPKVLTKWMNGKIELEEAIDLSKVSQPKQHLTTAIKNLMQIGRKDVDKLTNNDRNAFRNELRKCVRELTRIQNILKED